MAESHIILDGQFVSSEHRISVIHIIDSRAFDRPSAKKLMVELGDDMERHTRSAGSCHLSRAIELQRLGYGNSEQNKRFTRTSTGFKLSTKNKSVEIWSKGKFKCMGGKFGK